jgi:TonB family protein
MKTEPGHSSRRERNINTPEDLIKMMVASFVLHLLFIGVGLWFAGKLDKTRIYLPVYTVNLVSLPAAKPAAPPPVPEPVPQKKKPAPLKQEKQKVQEKKVATLKKTKAEPTPAPTSVPQKAEPTPPPAPPVEVAKTDGGQEGVSGPRQALTLDTLRFPYLWYLKNIQVKVNQNWSTLGLKDSPTPATIFFRIMRDGSVRDVKIEKSSGNNGLDNSAVQAVLLSAPFDPLPDGYSGNDLAIHYNFAFTGMIP